MKEFKSSPEQNNLSHGPRNERSTAPDGEPYVQEKIDKPEPWFKNGVDNFMERVRRKEKENKSVSGEPSLNTSDIKGEPKPASNVDQ